jgi:hypothetical protein
MTTSIKHLIITAGFVTRARGVAERPASLAPSAAQNGVANRKLLRTQATKPVGDFKLSKTKG